MAYHRIMSARVVDIDKLAPDERLRLIDALWESLRAEPQGVPVTSAHLDELDRRLDDLERNDVDVLSWDEVETRLHRRPA